MRHRGSWVLDPREKRVIVEAVVLEVVAELEEGPLRRPAPVPRQRAAAGLVAVRHEGGRVLVDGVVREVHGPRSQRPGVHGVPLGGEAYQAFRVHVHLREEMENREKRKM